MAKGPPPTAYALWCPWRRCISDPIPSISVSAGRDILQALQFSVLNAIPCRALCDSLVLLAVVLEQQTELQPTEIMTDHHVNPHALPENQLHFSGFLRRKKSKTLIWVESNVIRALVHTNFI
jgi:hypothetical protein